MQNKFSAAKNKLFPLREIAANNSISQSYVSILVQRKVLKAKKVGRNYFTTQEWFNEYLKNHSRNDRKSADQNKKLIPLRVIADANSYSIGYVSILVQRKVLKAKKVGRNYFTTQEWFNEYLKNHSREESIYKKSVDGQPSLIAAPASAAERARSSGRVAALDLEELSTKISDKMAALVEGKEIKKEIEKNKTVKAPGRRHWAIKFFQTAIAVLIIVISSAKLFPTATFHFHNLINSLYLSPIIKLTKVINFPASKNEETINPATAGQNSAEKGYVAGASEINLGFASIDEEIVNRQAGEAVSYFKGQFKKMIDFLNDNFYKFYLVFSNQVEDNALVGAGQDKVISAGSQSQTNGQGAVIVPFKNDEQAQEIKQKIQNMFSDQVIVKPGETPREGIIQPVFGAEPADQKYLYMMVPVTEDKKSKQ